MWRFPLVACGESNAGCYIDTYTTFVVITCASRYTERANLLEVSLLGFFAQVSCRTQQFLINPTYVSTDAEYLLLFVEQFMTREVRCWVTDRQTDRHTQQLQQLLLRMRA